MAEAIDFLQKADIIRNVLFLPLKGGTPETVFLFCCVGNCISVKQKALCGDYWNLREIKDLLAEDLSMKNI